MTTGLRKVWEWPACYGRSGYNLSRPILIFVAAKENGFACCGRGCNDPPRPILIFVAAKEMARLQNTTTPTDASILDFRARLENRCMVLPVYPLFRASILDFRPRLGNRCKDFPIYGLLRASILDLRGSIWESLQGFPTELVVSTVSASDSNFRCGKEEWFRLQRQSRRRSSASDSNLRCRRQEKS